MTDTTGSYALAHLVNLFYGHAFMLMEESGFGMETDEIARSVVEEIDSNREVLRLLPETAQICVFIARGAETARQIADWSDEVWLEFLFDVDFESHLLWDEDSEERAWRKELLTAVAKCREQVAA